jgi:hypothetical protein
VKRSLLPLAMIASSGCASDEIRTLSSLDLYSTSQARWYSAFWLAQCGRNDEAALRELDRLRDRQRVLGDWLAREYGRTVVDQAIQRVDNDEGVTDRICMREADPNPAISAMRASLNELDRRRRAGGTVH